jgi:Flp pilus assembly protein TadG
MRRLPPAIRTSSERGATAVEFALVMLPLLYLVLGIVQYGWYFYAMQAGTSATSDTVRQLSVGDCQVSAERAAYLSDRLGSASVSDSSIQSTVVYTSDETGHTPVGAPGVVGGGVELTVVFRTNDFNFPLVPVPDDAEVTRTVFARVEDTSASAGGCT